MKRILVFGLAVFSFGAGPGVAAEPAAASPADSAASEGTAGSSVRSADVPYTSGGISLEERQALSQTAGDYNLKLVFAATGGAYLGDVKVTISGPGGRVLDAVSAGPWFFAKLPPGKYRVEATSGGRTQSKAVSVGGRGQARAAFYFPGESR